MNITAPIDDEIEDDYDDDVFDTKDEPQPEPKKIPAKRRSQSLSALKDKEEKSPKKVLLMIVEWNKFTWFLYEKNQYLTDAFNLFCTFCGFSNISLIQIGFCCQVNLQNQMFIEVWKLISNDCPWIYISSKLWNLLKPY